MSVVAASAVQNDEPKRVRVVLFDHFLGTFWVTFSKLTEVHFRKLIFGSFGGFSNVRDQDSKFPCFQ